MVHPADTDDLGDAVDELRADYDQTPYTSVSFPPSAPGQLAAVAHLFGLETPEVSTARVLEIGCATGGNLIPFAAAHPQARVVGLDLSQVQIDLARTRVRDLDLNNVEFVVGDIARIDLTALGQFDFIIAHGVYSWVPPEVQEGLLSSLRKLLVPEGVAYLSYNVYPGWKSKEVLRDAMQLTTGGSATPSPRSCLPPMGSRASITHARSTWKPTVRCCSRTTRASRPRWTSSVHAGRGRCHDKSWWMRSTPGLSTPVSRPATASQTSWTI
jgi:SAM-dependent methyltransferase